MCFKDSMWGDRCKRDVQAIQQFRSDNGRCLTHKIVQLFFLCVCVCDQQLYLRHDRHNNME